SVARDRDRRLMLERQLNEMQRQNRASSDATGTTVSGGLDDLPEGSAQKQLAAARQALQGMEMRLKPEHPDVIRAKRLIADLEVKAREEQKALAEAAAAAASGAAQSNAVATSG